MSLSELPKDVLVLLALELDVKDILEFCLTSKRVDRFVCKNDDFWKSKLRTITSKYYDNPKEILLGMDKDPQIEFLKALKTKDNELANYIIKKYKVHPPIVGIKTKKDYITQSPFFSASKTKYPNINIIVFYLDRYMYIPRQRLHSTSIAGLSVLMQLADIFGVEKRSKYKNSREHFDDLRDKIIERLMELGWIYNDGDVNPFYR